ncbi:hypothetical protein RyT2_10500 [Pseudolactococcus yaeyamensis]
MRKVNLKSVYHQFMTKSDDIYNFLNEFDDTNKPQSELIDSVYFYISMIRKETSKTDGKSKIYFTLSKSNTKEQIKIDNVETQKRREIEKGENEGLGTDAHFLLINNILIQRKTRGVATIDNLISYLANKIDVKKKDINIDLILEKDVLSKFNDVAIFEKFQFKIAVPQQIGIFANDVDDELAKKKLADKFNAESLNFEVRGKQLNKGTIKQFINIFQNHTSSAVFKSLSVTGEGEFLDFVKGKLFWEEIIELGKNEELTEEKIYPFLKEAYDVRKEYLDAYQT